MGSWDTPVGKRKHPKIKVRSEISLLHEINFQSLTSRATGEQDGSDLTGVFQSKCDTDKGGLIRNSSIQTTGMKQRIH